MQPGLGMAVLPAPVLTALLHPLSSPIQSFEKCLPTSSGTWNNPLDQLFLLSLLSHPQHPGAVRSDGRGKQASAVSLTLCFLTPKLARKTAG